MSDEAKAGPELSGELGHVVFLVEKWEKHEGFSIEGVYASREKADAVSRELMSKIDPKRLWQFVEVTKWPVEV